MVHILLSGKGSKTLFWHVHEAQVVNIKIAIEPSRNSWDLLIVKIWWFLRNFQYRLEFLVSYDRIGVLHVSLHSACRDFSGTLLVKRGRQADSLSLGCPMPWTCSKSTSLIHPGGASPTLSLNLYHWFSVIVVIGSTTNNFCNSVKKKVYTCFVVITNTTNNFCNTLI